MAAGEGEQKIADRFHDLFHSSWARAAGALVTMSISIWPQRDGLDAVRSAADSRGITQS